MVYTPRRAIGCVRSRGMLCNQGMGVFAPLREVFIRSRDTRVDVSDAQLLRRTAEGEEAAFAELWRRYGAAVLGACKRILTDHGVAEDATQDAFARIWKSAASFDASRGEPAAWISRIARNTALNQLRGYRPEVRASIDVIEEGAVESLAERFWLRALLRRLSHDERVALELAYFHDLSHSQIAEKLGEPLGTVKARIRRGMIRLAELAEEDAP